MENFAPAINNDSNVAEGHIKKTKLGVGCTSAVTELRRTERVDEVELQAVEV